MHNTKADIFDLFEEAQRLLTDHELPSWLHVITGAPGDDTGGHRQKYIRGCPHCGTTKQGHTYAKCRQGRKKKVETRSPSRRAYKTSRQAAYELEDRVKQLRAGVVPKKWGKRWREAKAILEREQA